MKIGITERGDAALDTSWIPWVQDGKPAILISKDPCKLFDILIEKNLLQQNNYIVHCTITGMGGSVIESNVLKKEHTLQRYNDFISHIGKERTILRVDPIVPTKKGIITALSVIEHANSRVRISFLDMYGHVKARFSDLGISLPYESFHAPLEWRKEAVQRIKVIAPDVEICGEPDFECTGCVSQRDLKAMNIDYEPNEGGYQRKFCCCIAEKHELLKNKLQCFHQCAYCYWKNDND